MLSNSVFDFANKERRINLGTARIILEQPHDYLLG
jgi:hypothetical protein